MSSRAHLAGVFRWLPKGSADWVAVVGAGIGMAVPILLGGISGETKSGFAGALGGLLISGVGAGSGWRIQAHGLFHVLWPTVLAAALAAGLAGHGVTTHAVVILIAVMAAAVGGYDKTLALATTKFIAFLIIAVPAAEFLGDGAIFAVTMSAGAAFTVAVCLLLGAIDRAARRGGLPAAAPAAEPAVGEKLHRLGRTLRTLDGWQYAIRIAFCLGAASAAQVLWPDLHLHWIAVTVALVAERQLEPLPVKVTQRALGTALSVLATFLVIHEDLPLWGLVAGAAALAGARPWLKERNYLTYTVVMTPLVIVILDSGRFSSAGVLADRLLATGIAAVLLIVANVAVARLARRAA